MWKAFSAYEGVRVLLKHQCQVMAHSPNLRKDLEGLSKLMVIVSVDLILASKTSCRYDVLMKIPSTDDRAIITQQLNSTGCLWLRLLFEFNLWRGSCGTSAQHFLHWIVAASS
jgi:hypothetical protein